MFHFRSTAWVALLAGLAAAGCKGKPGAEAPPAPRVTVARTVMAPVRDYYEYNGYLDTTETVEVRARVKGLLTAIHFTEGTEVNKGDLLYEIDQREYVTAEKKAVAEVEKAKADVLNWEAQIKLAEAELERATTSNKSGVGSKTDLDKARAQLDVNKAEKNAADANVGAAEAALHTARIQLGYTKIYAEIPGRISQTRVTRGNLVGQTEPTLLTTIVRMDELYAFFDTPEADLLAYQHAMMNSPMPDLTSRLIEVNLRVGREEAFPHNGKIDFRENKVDTSTGTVRLRARIPNPPGPTGARPLYPGLYTHVRVPGGDPRPLPVIPEDALMTGQEGRFVYVVKPDNTVEKRIVSVGPIVWKAPAPEPGVVSPSWVMVNPSPAPEGAAAMPSRRPVRSMIAIRAGLTTGDRVIVEGVQRARPTEQVVPDEWVLHPPDAK